MPESIPYSYRALSHWEIRVLTLFPGDFGDELLVQLELYDLESQSYLSSTRALEEVSQAEESPRPRSPSRYSKDSYEALSYVWGSKTLSHRIPCLDGSYFEVTKSLYEALQYLRYSDKCRRIWADASCINQGDVAERASQVAIMATVFESASRVLVWLGQSRPGDALAFGMLHAQAASLDMRHESTDPHFNFSATLESILKAKPWCPCCGINFIDSKIHRLTAESGYHAVERLCSRRWFYRTWVYQEAACAQKIEVHCGTHHCSWELIDRFGNPEYNAINPSELEILDICRAMSRMTFDPCALLRLVVLLSHTRCEVPHDVVYGIRRIAGLDDFASLVPDYTIAPGEVYKRLVIESLLFEGAGWEDSDRWTAFLNADATAGLPLPHASLFLALPRTSKIGTKSQAEGLPSWTTALDSFTDCSFAKYYEYGWHLSFKFLECQGSMDTNKIKATRAHQLRVELVKENQNFLRILGCRVGHISEVLERSLSPLAYELSYDDLYPPGRHIDNIFHEWIWRCRQFVSTHAHLAMNHFKELMYCASLESGFDEDIYRELMKNKPSEEMNTELDFQSHAGWIIREFTQSPYGDEWKKLRYYDHFRNLSTTTAGSRRTLLGWIPTSAKPGDLLCLLVGCPRPFVLRQTKDQAFELLGDAWIHGLPDEISFSIPEADQEWFTLC